MDKAWTISRHLPHGPHANCCCCVCIPVRQLALRRVDSSPDVRVCAGCVGVWRRNRGLRRPRGVTMHRSRVLVRRRLRLYRLIREYIRYVAVFCLMCYPTMVWSWLFKVKVIAYGSLKLKEITYFGEITGPSSLSIQHYSGKQILRHFWKADIQYFIENYGWLLKLVAIWPFSEETLLQGPL